ncbi:DUF1292 domain-containing protein [uncultured Thomasclavelia sp.]|uniref:DUF1292 domain-containing protein n=1 Tax=uncultured Thomasclavelia sp. TaxID=3025759 RepID=UPI0025CE0711|nr:DUF1292 domain-containing protein [uncultured Thomasclavelia sp.]
MEANKIQVIDDQGNTKEFDVLFTFNNDELNKQYVLYYDATEEQPNVFASSYDENGQLFPIESPDEWELVEEVFQSFMGEQDHECSGNGQCCQKNHECKHEDESHQCCHEGKGHGCCHDNENN